MSTPGREAWDLVVVGAGPAGAAAALGALHADPGLRVLLLDRADFPRDKSCGDGIAPHVLDVLAGVGVTDVVDGWTPLTPARAGPRLADRGRAAGAGRCGSSRARSSTPGWSSAPPRPAPCCGATGSRRVVRRDRRRSILDDDPGAALVVGADGATRWCATALGRSSSRTPRAGDPRLRADARRTVAASR